MEGGSETRPKKAKAFQNSTNRRRANKCVRVFVLLVVALCSFDVKAAKGLRLALIFVFKITSIPVASLPVFDHYAACCTDAVARGHALVAMTCEKRGSISYAWFVDMQLDYY